MIGFVVDTIHVSENFNSSFDYCCNSLIVKSFDEAVEAAKEIKERKEVYTSLAFKVVIRVFFSKRVESITYWTSDCWYSTFRRYNEYEEPLYELEDE